MIDIHRLNSTTYCILVCWLNGSFSTSQIAKAIPTADEAAVKSACREKKDGGFLPKRRQFMTRGERQELLTYLRHYRMDGGRFDRGDFFTAVPISREPEEPVEIADSKSRAGKRSIRQLAHEAQVMRNADLKERQETEEGWNAVRGVNADPLSWLYKERLLKDPDSAVTKGQLDRLSEEMRRHECGLKLRKYLEEAQLSGFKEVNMERAGGASSTVSIPERFVMASSALAAIQSMMKPDDYALIVAVLRDDQFVWDSASTKEGRHAIMERIRRSLDVVALFIGMMEEKAFEARWGFVPDIRKQRSRDEVRETIMTARKIIQEGVRQ